MELSLTDFSPIDIISIAEEDVNYSIDTIYLFTWNPKDSMEFRGLNYKQKWIQMIMKYLCKLRKCCDKYCVVPEISDAGRLHCHGWLCITDKIKWHKSVLPYFKNNGMFKPNKLRHVNGFVYYVKDLDVTMSLLDNSTFPYSHLNYQDVDNCIYMQVRDKLAQRILKHRSITRPNALILAMKRIDPTFKPLLNDDPDQI